MLVTDWKSPTSNGQIISEWWRPAWSYSSDDNRSRAICNQASDDEQDYYNFVFTTTDIPMGSTITGIQARSELASQFFGTWVYLDAQLVKGGVKQGNVKEFACNDSVDTLIIKGGESDTWDVSFLDIDIRDSAFGIYLKARAAPVTFPYLFQDHIQIRVYFLDPLLPPMLLPPQAETIRPIDDISGEVNWTTATPYTQHYRNVREGLEPPEGPDDTSYNEELRVEIVDAYAISEGAAGKHTINEFTWQFRYAGLANPDIPCLRIELWVGGTLRSYGEYNVSTGGMDIWKNGQAKFNNLYIPANEWYDQPGDTEPRRIVKHITKSNLVGVGEPDIKIVPDI